MPEFTLVCRVTTSKIEFMLYNATTVKSLVTLVDPSTASQRTQLRLVSTVLEVTNRETVEARRIEREIRSNVQTAPKVKVMLRKGLP